LAEKLCHIRHRLKLTQEELKEGLEQLSFVSDLDRANVTDYERGRRDPDLLTLLSYGRLANVYLDVLVDDELDLLEDASLFLAKLSSDSKMPRLGLM
jgi:transcriptional regulator with XRE-family HTH domain